MTPTPPARCPGAGESGGAEGPGTPSGPMHVGLLAPPWVSVPPDSYGGTEVVVDNLARGLRARGHDVTLFTVGSSTCPVRRRSLFPAPAEPMGESTLEAAHVLAGLDALAGCDVIHDHTALGALLAGLPRRRVPPMVTTHHNLFTPAAQRVLATASARTAVVAISRSHARRAGRVPVTEVVPHGIDLDLYRAGPGDGGYLLFVGRMSPDKGVHRAARIARLAGLALVVVAKMWDRSEREYWEQVVRPLLGPGAPEPREEPVENRIELLRHATALLNPVDWPEPFGLVMAEALACGTPVVTRPCGAAPEIVDDGVTGFVTADDEAAAEAVARIPDLDRGACRRRAVELFSLDRMVGAYDRLYRRTVAARQPGARQRPHVLPRANAGTSAGTARALP